ncbi:MAG: MgtC/SapB family protein [Actinobacteria bacterium]|nr:MgtC/SapB family protein [Actinomycetota bacterium]MBT4677477.1 hypothetical protein [Acidimicrobiaceae bacterium]MBT5205993.1 hypothetical protein [Acidimicrobiaceae bacterium]MBT5568744.1 hypothetical protein [Acidimicrobiaceae bacterium]MBT6092298.1 hypothetical protein [Acidimicrobiaceae bacterium]
MELIGRLALALGAVLGLGRETRHKTAGLRTHSLVALGAALFTIAGAYAVVGPQNDPSQIAAQVVTGAMALVVVVTFGPPKPYVMFRRSRRKFEVRYRSGHGTLDALFTALESAGGRIMGVLTTESDDPSKDLRKATVDVRGLGEVELAKALASVADREEVIGIDHAPSTDS